MSIARLGAERVAAVVLAYGEGGEHGPLLASLLSEGMPATAILVVHNQASPGEATPPVPPGIEILQTERNLGYAGGMNRGIARQLESGRELLLLMTHDARLRPGALAALVAALDADRRCGICGPVLLLAGTEHPYSFGGVTNAGGENFHRKEPPRTAAVPARCEWVDGGTMLVRRDVFERIGAFDERFWGYCEEADLCLRARQAGFAVGVALGARADQEPGATKRLGAWSYLMTRNGLAYARRARGARGLIATGLRTVRTVVLSLVRTLLRGSGLRPGGREEPWAIAVGSARGGLDYVRGLWGPPPADLPGSGDLGNA